MTAPYLQLAELFKTLAHPVRLRILEVLAQGEASVSHLTTLVEQRQAYVSQQLMLLREAGLVRDRREGSTVIYALATPEIMRLLAAAHLPLADEPSCDLEPYASPENTPVGSPPRASVWTPEED